MTLPASGTISFSQFSTEMGQASTYAASMSWIYSATKTGQQSYAVSNYYSKAYYKKNNAGNCNNGNCTATNCNCTGDTQCNNCTNCTTVNCVNCDASSFLQTNCNCACTYNCTLIQNVVYNCHNCIGTCFPFGSFVKMANGDWKDITQVKRGDMVWSPNGSAEIDGLDITRVGNRPMYQMSGIEWSGEHTFWVQRNNEQRLWSMHPELLKEEADRGDIGGLLDYGWLFSGEVGCDEQFVMHNNLLCKQSPMPYHLDPNTPLYVPRTKNGELISVNGYIVGACVNERGFDYRKLVVPVTSKE